MKELHEISNVGEMDLCLSSRQVQHDARPSDPLVSPGGMAEDYLMRKTISPQTVIPNQRR
jgi:hypothetical protein